MFSRAESRNWHGEIITPTNRINPRKPPPVDVAFEIAQCLILKKPTAHNKRITPTATSADKSQKAEHPNSNLQSLRISTIKAGISFEVTEC
jgi:hypothetical protein